MVSVIALVAFCGAVRAQNLQTWEPAPLVTDLLTVQGAETLKGGRFVPMLHTGFAAEPLVQRSADGRVVQQVLDGMLTIEPQLAYGVVDRLTVMVALPMVSTGGDAQAKCPPAEPGCGTVEVPTGFGFGDLRLDPRLRVLGGRPGDAFGMAVALPLTLPTGDEDKLIGGSTVSLTPRLIVEWRPWILHLVANAGFRWRPRTDTFQNIEVGNEALYGAGVSVPTGLTGLRAMLEAVGSVAAEEVVDRDVVNPLEILFGVRWHDRSGLVVGGGGGLGVLPDKGTPKARFLMTLGYQRHPEVPDAPVEVLPVDSDGDGLLDHLDACPDEAEDVDGFLDGDGCPELDNDRDGFSDAVDKCPNEAETPNGVDDHDGCPDGTEDRDGDRVPDTLDPCPGEAEDRDDFEDDDGCPDPDNDKDGFPDVRDRCPYEPERINGREDDDGCPEPGHVELIGRQLKLLTSIEFELARPVILEESAPVLDDVARLLNARKDLELVVVEGHTDERGDPRVNLTLSRDRARAVRDALIRRGVWRGRLAATGYGGTKPLVPGDHDANARIELRATTAAQAPNLLQALKIDVEPDHFEFLFRTTRKAEARKVWARLDGPKVLMIVVPDLDVARERLRFQHLLIERVLLLPGAGEDHSAILRVRFKRDLPPGFEDKVVVGEDEDGALRVTVPQP